MIMKMEKDLITQEREKMNKGICPVCDKSFAHAKYAITNLQKHIKFMSDINHKEWSFDRYNLVVKRGRRFNKNYTVDLDRACKIVGNDLVKTYIEQRVIE